MDSLDYCDGHILYKNFVHTWESLGDLIDPTTSTCHLGHQRSSFELLYILYKKKNSIILSLLLLDYLEGNKMRAASGVRHMDQWRAT